MARQDDSKEIELLKELRKTECFPIVNRGRLWYDCLSTQEIVELRTWYEAWLNVTETKQIPVKPSWLDKKLENEEITW